MNLKNEQMKRLAEENPDIRRMVERRALHELNRTLHRARIRCLEPDEIIGRLPKIMTDADRGELLIRLAELELTQDQIEAVADAVRMLAAYGETVPSREKPRVDATIARIIRVLPQETANELVRPLLEHSRRSQRDVVYNSLRRIGITARLAHDLIAIFQRTGDERMLELIARTANVVPEVDAKFLLQNLSDDYWRMRVMEALLHHLPQRAVELAADYPREFIWAVGRARTSSYLPLMERIVEAGWHNIELLSIYAWALGQLSAERQLDELSQRIRQSWLDDPEILYSDLRLGCARNWG